MANTGQGVATVFKTALTANDSSAKEELGTIRTEYDSTNGPKTYMYVLANGAIAAGTPVILNRVTGYTVGPDTVNAIATKRCVGVGIGTITTAYYGWIQVRGHSTNILTHADACTTAYMEMVYLCGTVRSLKYQNTTTLGASSYFVLAGITAHESLATACTTMSGYIHCM